MYGTEVGVFHERHQNASTASCRHIMALHWKHKSVLPTDWAISWTSCEKGSFWIRSSVLFWNCWFSQRATVPGQYFLVFFTFHALRNSFSGSFASHGRAELPLSRLLSQSRWPSLCSHFGPNCWVGNDDGDWPTSSSHLASSTHLSASSNVCSTSLAGEGFLAGGGVVYRRGGPPSLLWNPSALLRCLEHSSSLPLLLRCHFGSHHTIKKNKRKRL